MTQQPAKIPGDRSYDLTHYMNLSSHVLGLPLSDPRLQDPSLKHAGCCPGGYPYQNLVRDNRFEKNPVTKMYECCTYPESPVFLAQLGAMFLAIGFGHFDGMRAISPVLSALSDFYLHHLEHQLTRLKNLSPFKQLHVNQCDVRHFLLKFAPQIAGGPADRLVPFDELYDIPLWTNGFRPDGHTLFIQRTLVTAEFALDLDEVNVYRRFIGALTPDIPEIDRRMYPPASRSRRYLPVTTFSLPLHMQVVALDVERLS